MGLKRILLIDDDRLIHEFIMNILKDSSYKLVAAVTNIAEAEKIISENDIDLVLLDVMLADSGNGLVFARHLRDTLDMPVILQTGIDEESYLGSLKEDEYFQILYKPYSGKELLSNIKLALYNRMLLLKIHNEEIKYKKIFESTSDAIISVNQKGDLISFNPAFSEMFGYMSAELEGFNVSKIFPPEQDTDSIVKKIYQIGFLKNLALVFITKNNQMIKCNVTANIIKNSSGEIKGFQGIFHEISGEIVTESLLAKENEKKFKTIFNLSINSIFIIGLDGNFIDVNQTAHETFGYSFEEMLGMKIEDLILFEKINHFKIEYELLKEKGKIFFEIEMLTKNKGSILFDVSCRLIDFAGELAVLYSCIDITDRKKKELELHEANLRMKYLYNSITSVIIGVSEHDVIEYFNKASEEIFNLSASKVIGKKFFEADITWETPKIYEGIANCVSSKFPIRLDDISYTRKNGKSGLLGIVINPIIAENDEIIGFIIFGADITDKKMQQNEVSQKQKMESIGQLAAGIAHEINTPTQYINDNTRFLKEAFVKYGNALTDVIKIISEKSNNVNMDEYNEILKKNDIEWYNSEVPTAIDQSLEGLERVITIVQSMKEFSHPGGDEKVLADINKLIQSTINISRNEWKYIAEIHTDFSDNLPQILCYPGEFNQVILNIIINASQALKEVYAKATEIKGVIDISTKLNDQGFIEININDNGPGIPEKIIGKIFDPFFTTKIVGEGTGQGLAIAYSIIVEKHHGMIRAKSKQGEGAAFIIELPVE